MGASASFLSIKDHLFYDLPFDEAGKVTLKNFREWFWRKLNEEKCPEVLDREISRLFVHLGAREEFL